MATTINALVGAVVLVPLVAIFGTWPLQSIVADGSTLVLAVALGACAAIRLSDATIRCPRACVPLVAVAACIAITAALAEYAIAIDPLSQLITLGALGIALTGLGRVRAWLGDEGYLDLLGSAFVALGCIYSVASLLLHYGAITWPVGPGYSSRQLEGLWLQPNLTTTTLWLALVVGSWSLWRRSQWRTFLALALLVGISCGLASSGLNVLYIIFAYAVAAVYFRWGSPEMRAQARWLASGCTIVLVCLLLSAALPGGGETPDEAERSDTASLAAKDAYPLPRIEEHRKIIASMPSWSSSQWLVGIGPGNYPGFSHGLPVTPTKPPGEQNAWLHSHNIFSTVLVEQGLLGLAVLLAVSVLLALRLWNNRHKVFAIPVMAGIGILFLHSNIEFPLWYPWFAFVLCALAVPLFGDYRIHVDSPRMISVLGGVILAVVAITAANVGVQVHRIHEAMTAKTPARDDQRRLAYLEAGSIMAPYATLARYRRFDADRSNVEGQLRRARQISEWRPLDVVQVRLVTLLARSGDQEAACATARDTASRYPASGPILVPKLVAASMTSKVDPGRLIQCIEAGLATWDVDLADMQRLNDERMEKLRRPTRDSP